MIYSNNYRNRINYYQGILNFDLYKSSGVTSGYWFTIYEQDNIYTMDMSNLYTIQEAVKLYELSNNNELYEQSEEENLYDISEDILYELEVIDE